jgi:hypothetical protein
MLSRRDHAKQETSNEARLEALMLLDKPGLVVETLLELDRILNAAGFPGLIHGDSGLVSRLESLVGNHGLGRDFCNKAPVTENEVFTKLAKRMRGLRNARQ